MFGAWKCMFIYIVYVCYFVERYRHLCIKPNNPVSKPKSESQLLEIIKMQRFYIRLLKTQRIQLLLASPHRKRHLRHGPLSRAERSE